VRARFPEGADVAGQPFGRRPRGLRIVVRLDFALFHTLLTNETPKKFQNP
jgi:hypothetical protein